MNETQAEKLDQLKAEIRTLGQELENIVSIESIAMRLILKNILDIANQLSEPTIGEKVDGSLISKIDVIQNEVANMLVLNNLNPKTPTQLLKEWDIIREFVKNL